MNRIVVIVVALALVLAAVGGGVLALVTADDSSPDSSSTSEPTVVQTTPTEPVDPAATEPPTPELAPFYSQTISWEQCGGLLCGTVTVPIDYRDPGGATIDLAINKVPAADPSRFIGPLVVNPGGPGVPGTNYAEQATSVFRTELLDRFDIIGFDPRGTGESDPVDCLSDEELQRLAGLRPRPRRCR